MTAVEKLNRYVEDVLSGKIPACKQIKQACDRHLWDIERQAQDDFGYQFNHARVEHVMSFMERLINPQSGLKIKLQDWHYFVIGSIFGWVTKEKGEDNRYARRYNQAELFVGRANGKSFICSGIALYMMLFDGQRMAEVFSVATQAAQAKIVFDTTVAFAKASGLENLIRETRDDLKCPGMGSVFRPLASDAKRLDGLRPHCAILDELHEMPSPKIYDVMKSALGKTSQPLLFIISTAGTRIDGIGHKLWKIGEHILNSIRTDDYDPNTDSFFAALYTIDQEDDPYDESVWIKANPTLGIIKPYKVIREDRGQVKIDPTALSNFKTKHLNVFCQSTDKWLDLEYVDAAYDPYLKLEQYKGRDCWIGMDLSDTLDFTALSLVFPNVDGSVDIIAYAYLPETVFKNPRIPKNILTLYQKFQERGELILTPGNTVDYGYISDQVAHFKEIVNLKSVALDPALSKHITARLENYFDIEMIHVSQKPTTMTEPSKHFQILLMQNKIKYNSSVFKWCCLNAEVEVMNHGLIHVKKENATSPYKIDCLIAAITAMAVAVIPDHNFNPYDAFDGIDMITY